MALRYAADSDGVRLKTMARKSLLLLLAVTALGCGDSTSPCRSDPAFPTKHPERVTVSRGVWGLVDCWEGDFMPVCLSGRITPVGRDTRIHALTRPDQGEGPGPFFSEVRTPEVARVRSDADGFFQAALAPGEYSLFSVEDELSYSAVPTEFGILVERLVVTPVLRRPIDDLLVRKRSGAELDSGQRIPAISEYIEGESSRRKAQAVPAGVGQGDTAELDRLFREALRELWDA
jgi:hypothetical protein